MTRRSNRFAASRASTASIPQPEIDLSPMVDIAFLLLIFFLVTSTLDPKEADLGFKMIPDVSQSPQTPFIPEEIAVEVKADGSVWCGGDLMESGIPDRRHLPALLDRLRLERSVGAVANRGLAQPVIVSVDAEDSVSGQRLMDVLDTVAESGIDSVRLVGFVDR